MVKVGLYDLGTGQLQLERIGACSSAEAFFKGGLLKLNTIIMVAVKRAYVKAVIARTNTGDMFVSSGEHEQDDEDRGQSRPAPRPAPAPVSRTESIVRVPPRPHTYNSQPKPPTPVKLSGWRPQ